MISRLDFLEIMQRASDRADEACGSYGQPDNEDLTDALLVEIELAGYEVVRK